MRFKNMNEKYLSLSGKPSLEFLMSFIVSNVAHANNIHETFLQKISLGNRLRGALAKHKLFGSN